MKQIIYLDNDKEDMSEIERHSAYKTIQHHFPQEMVENMKNIFNFGEMEKQEAFKLLFESDSVIVTWSMYTVSHQGSAYQVRSFLGTAGRSDVKNVVYVDASGMLVEFLNKLKYTSLTDKNPLEMMIGVSRNFIFSVNEKSEVCRLTFDLSSDENFINLEPVENIYDYVNAHPKY